MPSSRRPRLAAEARDDLRDILQHSLETWGRSQHDAYQAAIRRGLTEIATYPRLGRQRDDLFPGCRSLPIRQHVFYYLVDGDDVYMVRILHERRDPSATVGEPDPR